MPRSSPAPSRAGRAPWRNLVPLLLLAVAGYGAARVVQSAQLEPADFTFINGTEVATLDPATVTGVPEGRVLRAIFEGLTVKHPQTLDPLPGMAERWEISEDKRTYTFYIREGAVWSNGDPIDAYDFTYSWERFLNPQTAAEYAYQLWYVKNAKRYSTEVDDDGQPTIPFEEVGIKALDERTLQVELEAPTPFFLQLTAFYPLFPVNRRNIEEAQERFPDDWKNKWLQPENLVTNGAFRIAERRVNDRIRLVKNESYWDADSVAFDSIDVLAVEQYMTNLNLYLQGDADWINYIPNQLIPRLLEREDFDPGPYFGSYFYRVNVTQPPFDDVRIRRALALCIDRKAICEKITKAGQQPYYALVPPMPGYEAQEMQRPGAGLEYAEGFAADIAEAKQLILDAGYGPEGAPFPTIEIHYNTSETHRDIAEVIADSWKRNLGVRCKLLNQEWKVYLDTQRSLDYDVSRSAWIGDYLDPNTFMDIFVTGGENNKTGWGDPRYDELIAQASAEPDADRRNALLMEAERLLMDELPILPIYAYTAQNIVNPRLGGLEANPLDEQFPKWWYWRSDAELDAWRQRRALEGRSETQVEAPGPAAGLYPAVAPAGAFPESDPRHAISPLLDGTLERAAGGN